MSGAVLMGVLSQLRYHRPGQAPSTEMLQMQEHTQHKQGKCYKAAIRCEEESWP